MSTKKTTDSSQKQNSTQATTFDPGSMGRYQGWANALMPQLQSMFSNPMGSPFFNQQLQASTRGASALAGRNMQNSLQSFNRSGVGSGSMFSGARNSLMGGLNRYGSGLQYQGFNNAVNNAQTNMWNAGQLGSSLFQPLQTGGTFQGSSTNHQTETTGGLGTWLPQLIGAGLGMATGGLTGGLGGMIKNVGGSAANSAINASVPMTQMPGGQSLWSQPVGGFGGGGGATGGFNPFLGGIDR